MRVKSLNGTSHVLVVFKIVSEDGFGRPCMLEMLADTEVIDVTKVENRKFLTAWVPAHMAQASAKTKA